MKPHELNARLKALPRLPLPARRSEWRIICEAVDEPWFDVVWYQRLVEAGLEHRLDVTPEKPAELEVGESWLLLAHADGREGLTGRLRLLRGATPDEHLDVSGLNAMRDAHLGLTKLLGASCRQLPAGIRPTSCRLELSAPTATVQGASLGLATAIALVSLGLEKPPRSDVAASAIVNVAGELERVNHLPAKLADLARRRPSVRVVLVAGTQKLPEDVPAGIEVRPCASLGEALEMAGLDVKALPDAPLDDFLRRLRDLEQGAARKHHGPDEWLALARDAYECAHALLSEPACRDDAARAFACAALFAVHGGRNELAKSIHDRVEELGLDPSPAIQAWLAIGKASGVIDRTPKDAIPLAEQALWAVRSLSPHERDPLLGQALGTLGRAHLHAGAPQEALPFLKQAVEHHEAHDYREVPRSMTYLATALRHAGQVDEATSTIEDALARMANASRWTLSATTERYARLERGRCALTRGNAVAALQDFEFVIDDGGDTDEAHPRISAIRGLAAAYRHLGDAAQARAFLGRCVAVAKSTESDIYRKLGLMAVGDGLVAGERLPDDMVELWKQLTRSFKTNAKAIVGNWVY